MLLVSLFFVHSGKRHRSPKEEAATGEVPKGASNPEGAAVVAPHVEERRRPGYCECCVVKYGDLTMVRQVIVSSCK